MANTLEVIYEETKNLILICENYGYLEEKKRLKDSLSYGCTFGEILSNISIAIKELLKNNNNYCESFMNKAYEILKLINGFH